MNDAPGNRIARGVVVSGTEVPKCLSGPAAQPL